MAMITPASATPTSAQKQAVANSFSMAGMSELQNVAENHAGYRGSSDHAALNPPQALFVVAREVGELVSDGLKLYHVIMIGPALWADHEVRVAVPRFHV